jgi:tetratricopeptide (TPR) repeat protein
MPHILHTFGFILLIVCGSTSTQAQPAAPEPSTDHSPAISETSRDMVTRSRLAIELCRYASDMLAVPPISLEAINSSKIFLDEAVRLDPSSDEIAYRALEVAILSEDQDAILAAVDHALKQDPGDETVQLRRLVMAIDRFQLAEERVRAYEILLEPANQASMGPALSARLAFQLALLYRRIGDQDQFGRWVGESMAIDPSYSEAMAIGAGYFQARIDDPVSTVELLVSLLMADLIDTSTPTVLANTLMEHGAYAAAERMYQLSISTLMASSELPSNNLLADYVLTEWANGQGSRALSSIHERQMEMDQQYRMLTRERQPDLSPLDLAKLEAPISPTLATIRAVIASDTDPDQASDAMLAAKESYLNAIGILDSTTDPTGSTDSSREQAAAMLELAWLQLWLGDDVADAERRVSDAAAKSEMDDDARARFDGWILFRQGYLEDATTTLTPLVDSDPAARLGLAMVQQEQGMLQDAAKNFLELARQSSGTLIGIWSQHRLEELLGSPVPLSEEAAAMTSLVDSIPRVVDRYGQDPRLAISFRVEPDRLDVAPYEPVSVALEFTNKTAMPMAISPEGPLRELLLLRPDIRVTGLKPIQYGPFIYNIGRRLRLDPHESIVMHVDLRVSWVGRVLNLFPLEGANVLLTSVTNFIVSNNNSVQRTTFEPGMLGTEVTAAPIRVDGVRVTDDWAAGVIVAMKSATIDAQTLTKMALLTAAIARDTLNENEAVLSSDVRARAGEAILDAFPRCDPIQQAWLLSVVRMSDSITDLQSIALRDQDRLTTMILLIRLLEQTDNTTILDDPLLASSLRSDDPSVRGLAEWIERRVEQLLENELAAQKRRNEQE